MTTTLLRKLILIGATPLLFAVGGQASAAKTELPTEPIKTQLMTKDQMKDRYNAAMERCDTLEGNEKDVCKKQAKADRESAEADAKAGKKTAEAEHDATEKKRDAAYDVAKEKCGALSGDAKDQCIAEAKTKYGK